MKRTDEAKECIAKISGVFKANEIIKEVNSNLKEEIERLKKEKLEQLEQFEAYKSNIGRFSPCDSNGELIQLTQADKRRLDTQDSCETAYKAQARDLIGSFIWEAIEKNYVTRKNSLMFLGLPCVQALFEHKLARDCDVMGIKLHMDGAEYLDENIIQVLRNKPKELNVAHGGLENLYFTEKEYNSAGVIVKVTELKNNGVADYDVVWADYCGTMTEEKIAVNVELMSRKSKVCNKNKKGFMLFLTFSAPRNALAHEKKLERDEEGITLKEQMMSQFEEALTAANVVYAPILRFGYVGGKGTPMLTMGFAVGACIGMQYIEIDRAKGLEDKTYRTAVKNYVKNLNNDIKFKWIGKYGEKVEPRRRLVPIEVAETKKVKKEAVRTADGRTSSKQPCEWMTEERKEIIRQRGWELRAQGLDAQKVNDIIFGEVKHFDVRMRPKNVSATTSTNVFKHKREDEDPEYRKEVEQKLLSLRK
jgi:hypothetical protein